MFNEKDILARLQNGESAEAIAKEMTAALNAANKTYADEKAAAAKKAEEEAKAKELAIQKKKEFAVLGKEFGEWMKKYYATTAEEAAEFDKAFEKVSVDDFVELIDSIHDYSKILSGMKLKVSTKPVKKIAKVNPDDIFDAFFKEMGW